MSTTQEVIHLMGVSDAVPRAWSAHLELESSAKPKVSRSWTANDVCQLLIGQKLTNAGFSVPVALAMVREMARHFVVIAATEVPCFLLAWQDEAEPKGWGFASYFDKAKLMDEFLDRPTALVLNVNNLVKEALWRILQAQKAENAARQEADGDE